jgi:TPR repeat protein
LPQTPSAGLPAPTTLSAETASPQPLAKAPASLPPAASDTGESQLKLARQYLDGHVQPRNPAVASQLLWAAVEKGNSAAEMDLADLYLHGDGVARNCDQARVLLSVASKGNPEAAQKLHELDQSGCR